MTTIFKHSSNLLARNVCELPPPAMHVLQVVHDRHKAMGLTAGPPAGKASRRHGSQSCRSLQNTAAQTFLQKQDAVTKKHRSLELVDEHLENLFTWKDKVALVTGAAGAIGSMICLALAKRGAHILAVDNIDPETSETPWELVDAVESCGTRILYRNCDVRDAHAIEEVLHVCADEFNRLDIVIANAGGLGDMRLPQEMDFEEWRRVFALNCDAVMHCAKAAYPLLKECGRGKVVIVSSIAATTGYAHQAAYCAAKGALHPLARSLALAWAKDGICVNVVMPGAANTRMSKPMMDSPEKLRYILDRIPLGRLAEPEDLVGPILFFASAAADYCTGSSLVIDGGGTSRAMAISSA